MSEFRPYELLEALDRQGVRYVLIGGLAAAFHGSVVPTYDVDITPEMTSENLTRLSAALDELDARIRVDGIPQGLPFAHGALSLQGLTTVNLVTRCGPLDIATQPAGVSTFDDWQSHAIEIDASGIRIMVGALEDIIKSKESANRDKDRAALPTLRSLLDRIRRGD